MRPLAGVSCGQDINVKTLTLHVKARGTLFYSNPTARTRLGGGVQQRLCICITGITMLSFVPSLIASLAIVPWHLAVKAHLKITFVT